MSDDNLVPEKRVTSTSSNKAQYFSNYAFLLAKAGNYKGVSPLEAKTHH